MKKMIAMIFILISLSCVCIACKETENIEHKQPYNVSFVTVIANNNPVIDTTIDELVKLPELEGSTYSCILADSNPNVIFEGTISDFSSRGFSEDMLKRIQKSIIADIATKLNNAMPDNPQVDILSATSLAVRMLRANEVEGRDNILVFYGTGISTSGVVDMTKVPVYKLDVEASVESLSKSLLIDMSGIQVIFYCCGDVAGDEQPTLSDKEKNTLKLFYDTLFKRLGADDVIFRNDVPKAGSYNFEQQVSVMKTEEVVSGLKPIVVEYEDVIKKEDVEELEEVIDDVFTEGNIISFDETSIAFKSNSTELVDMNATMKALEYVVDYMNSNQEFKLLVCGTTTSFADKDFSIAFSKKRAAVIRNLLIEEAGISEDRIYSLGCGWSSCLYINDRDNDGTLNENAPQNRSVKLVDYNSDTAKQIMNSLSIQ